MLGRGKSTGILRYAQNDSLKNDNSKNKKAGAMAAPAFRKLAVTLRWLPPRSSAWDGSIPSQAQYPLATQQNGAS